MADQKITALTSLAQADIVSGTDVLPIVDVGAPSVTKKATPQAVVGASVNDLAQTWNAGGTTFTAVKMNVTDTASAAGSLLMDLQVGGVSQFKVTKAGRLTALGRASIDGVTVGKGGQTAVATNTAVGGLALQSASCTGANNTAVGYGSLNSNTSGELNVAFGTSAMETNTTGAQNAAVGHQALLFNQSGNFNAALGLGALRSQTTASENTGCGYQAGYSTTTGAANTFFGSTAGYQNTTGEKNTAVGSEALYRVRASNHVAMGYRALFGGDATPANNTGANNIGIGFQAGDAITTGSTNIAIGYDVDVDSPTASNQINIGNVYFHDRLLYTERADPAAPAANQAVVYARDNGSGKTQLCVRFNTGAIQVLATEP